MRKVKNYIIDINHPSQIHLFRNLYLELSKDNKVIVTVKKIDILLKLLEKYGIPYELLGEFSDTLAGKGINQIKYIKSMYGIVKRNNIDIGIGTSFTLNHVSKISRLISFFFDDDDSNVQPFTKFLGNPFADYIITPACLGFENYGKKHLIYPGNHELAYLHPNRFNPDPTVLSDIGLTPNDSFFVLRFNAFKAHHDLGVSGIPNESKIELVKKLSQHGKVFITNERESISELLQYQLKIPQEKIHSLLFYAKMFIGDSQTMTSEASVLGTPSIRCNTLVGKIAYLEELEKKYGLTFGFKPDRIACMFQKIDELLKMKNLKDIWFEKKQAMLADMIDVTSFMLWMFDQYPHSIEKLKNNDISWNLFK